MSCTPEPQKLGRTIRKWFDKICNYHLARVSNGPTEALNNLVKRIERSPSDYATSRTITLARGLDEGCPACRLPRVERPGSISLSGRGTGSCLAAGEG